MEVAKKIIRTVEIEVWDCGDPSHSHRLEQTANSCIAKRGPDPFAGKNRWTDDKLWDVLQKRRAGLTLKAIGRDYGVTAESIRKIEARALRKERLALKRAAEALANPH